MMAGKNLAGDLVKRARERRAKGASLDELFESAVEDFSNAAAESGQFNPVQLIQAAAHIQAMESEGERAAREKKQDDAFARMRKAQEDVLLQAHADGRIEAAVLRLPDFYGPGVGVKSLLGPAAQVAVEGGTADLVGPIDTPHEFVFVPDVGPVVARVLAAPGAWGRVWHLAGAGVTTQKALVEEMERQVGHPVRTRVSGKTMLRVVGLFNPVVRELVEMHYLHTDPVVMDDSALRQLIGPIAKMPYAEGVRRTLEAVRAARAGATREEHAPA